MRARLVGALLMLAVPVQAQSLVTQSCGGNSCMTIVDGRLTTTLGARPVIVVQVPAPAQEEFHYPVFYTPPAPAPVKATPAAPPPAAACWDLSGDYSFARSSN